MSSSLLATKKRKQFSLSEKVDILRQLEEGKKQAVVAKELGVARSTIATILKDKDKIMKCQDQSQLAPSRKRLWLGDFQPIDSAVLTWFKDVRAQNVPVSGPLIQEKTRQFAAILNVTDFEASSGWLHRFRQRNAITWQTVSGEEKAADEAAASTVTSTAVQNCWRKAGLMHTSEQPEDAGQPCNDDQAEEGNPGELWSEVTDLLAMDSVSFDDYVLCDEGTTTSAELTTEDILQANQDEGSDDGVDDAADNEGATSSQPEDCDTLPGMAEC
ncbi:hypothetical protein HPB52_003128 [Rhipicephalus sanguineus]|uniref:Uncharacterized protein n=1 Tax=Rhipicephalus sanguineus TaxID=34632 RepID=A0A9D4SVI7_RHISA|nr:hypothetical protein HPB52_003128 [Rhipicephalus sanguineus]